MPEAKLKTIDGMEFQISQPYAEGHACTEAEAKALNQTRSENVGNNTRATIKKMKEEERSFDEIKAYVAEVDAEYTFTLASVAAGAKLDPYEREARKIARELLKAHLAETGRKLTVPPEGETKESWGEKVQAQVEAIAENDEIKKAAKSNVDSRKKQADKLAGALEGASL